jgi:hypothetical protein
MFSIIRKNGGKLKDTACRQVNHRQFSVLDGLEQVKNIAIKEHKRFQYSIFKGVMNDYMHTVYHAVCKNTLCFKINV